jgi:hypothetical protein
MARDISRTDFRTIWQAIPPGEVKNDEPRYGLKEHASVDCAPCNICCWKGVEKKVIVEASANRMDCKELLRGVRKNGYVLATTITPASVHDYKSLPYLTLASCHTKEPIDKVYADKGYYGEPNRVFLHLNEIKDGIMRNDTTTTNITEAEIESNKRYRRRDI